jgi:Ran-binding protein 3
MYSVAVHTGEEDEETVYQVRGKLFALSSQNQWKERGTGQLKLNVRQEDGSGARLCMSFTIVRVTIFV